MDITTIKKAMVDGAEIEGEIYAHKALSLEQVKWLIEQVEAISRLKRKTELLEEGICSNSCLGTDILNELEQLDKKLEMGNE